MIKQHSIYKLVSVVVLTLTLGSTVAYANNLACPEGKNLAANIANGQLSKNGWQSTVRHVSTPVLAEVQLMVHEQSGDSIACEYVQKNHSGRYESFVIKKKASSAKQPFDVAQRSDWSSIVNRVATCYPSSTNKCELISLNSQVLPMSEQPSNCEVAARHYSRIVQELTEDEHTGQLTEEQRLDLLKGKAYYDNFLKRHCQT